MDVNKIVAHYVALRDQKKEMEARHKAELAPLKQDMEEIENALQKHMLDQNVRSLPCKAGTPYISEVASARVNDWDAVLDYIIENQKYEFLERRVSKTALQESGEQVPGVELVTVLKTNIRRS